MMSIPYLNFDITISPRAKYSHKHIVAFSFFAWVDDEWITLGHHFMLTNTLIYNISKPAVKRGDKGLEYEI